MQATAYTPGYSAPILSFMEQRTAETHAAFFLPRLMPGWSLLDAGCGPGTITLGLARTVAPGLVTGIDVEDSQFAKSREQAEREALNVEFRKASVYQLPCRDHCFDAVFSHALLEHLSDPVAALAELRRVLKPQGLIGIRAGDLGGILIDSESEGPAQGLAAYLAKRETNCGDIQVGRKLGRLLRKAEFTLERMTASYEVVTETLLRIGPSLAAQFAAPSYCSLQDKPGNDSLFVALAWCEAVAQAR